MSEVLPRCPAHAHVVAISDEAERALNLHLGLECFDCFFLAMIALTPDGEWFPDVASIRSIYGTMTRYVEEDRT